MKMRLLANAKINLTLDICGKRADGYHLIDSVMQSISIYDRISVEKAEKITVSCSDGLIAGEENIAFLAAKVFFEETAISGGADIYIEKGIPKAAGLGGGSADAAAVIVALDRLYETNLSVRRICEIGLLVGADVPFCIVGGTKRVKGIGEEIASAPRLSDCAILLIKDGIKGSTGEMYRLLDLKPQSDSKTDEMIAALSSGDIVAAAKSLDNAFLSVCDVKGVVDEFLKTNPLGVSLSGSGPTVFAIYPDDASADSAKTVLEGIGFCIYKAKPQSKGVIVE